MGFRYFLDPGADVCLWADDDEAHARFEYPVRLEELPLSADTVLAGQRLIDWFCSRSIDWHCPNGPPPWSAAEEARFHDEAERFYERLVAELAPDFEIVNELRR